MVNQKGFKEDDSDNSKEVKMGIFGNGKGFLGLSVKYRNLITVISFILGIIGLSYFIYTKQILLALGIFAIWILIQIENNK